MSDWPEVVPSVAGSLLLLDLLDLWPEVRSYSFIRRFPYWPYFIVRAAIASGFALLASVGFAAPPFVIGVAASLVIVGVVPNTSFAVGTFNILNLRGWLESVRSDLIDAFKAEAGREKIAARTRLTRVLVTKAQEKCVRQQYDILRTVIGGGALPDPAQMSLTDIAHQLAKAGWAFCKPCLGWRERLSPFSPRV